MPKTPQRLFAEALGLWRGRPFADLDDEPFVRDAIVVLDEAWLVAMEQRIEADLALGRHAQLVGELRALVRRHPLRERLRAQLMLALYRSGRQAEALEAYADARRTLVDELGLEPGPELQRLQQASCATIPRWSCAAGCSDRLGTPRVGHARRRATQVSRSRSPPLRSARRDPTRRRNRDERFAGTADGSSRSTGPAEPSSVSLQSGGLPAAIAARDGHVWVVDAEAQTVVHVDQADETSETLATGATPTDVAAGPAAVWVANGRRLDRAQFVGPVATAVSKLDPGTRTERADVRSRSAGGDLSNLVDNHLAATETAVWAVTPSFEVVRIGGRAGRITARTDAVRAVAVAAGGAGVWVLGIDGTVAQLDESTARPLFRTRLPTSSVTAIAVGADAAWVTSATDGTLWRVSRDADATLGSIELASGAADVATGDGHVWVVNPVVGTLTAVDEETGNDRPSRRGRRNPELDRRRRRHRLGRCSRRPGDRRPRTSRAYDRCPRASASRSCRTEKPTCWWCPTSRCRAASARTCRRWRRRSRSCSASTGSARAASASPTSCATTRSPARGSSTRRNVGRTHRRTPGTRTSSPSSAASTRRCTLAALPIAQQRGRRRRRDDLAPQLLRRPDPPRCRRAELAARVAVSDRAAELRPRVFPFDDLEGAALALFARDRGQTRVFVLDDGDPVYGALMATAFETAASRLGLTVAGRLSWDPRASSYAELADRVAASGATAVFVGGLLDTNAARVIRDLRARLPDVVDLLAPSLPLSLLVQRAGRAAFGTYVSFPGIFTDRLPAAGARFVKRFGRTQAGVPVEPSAVYAAQATEVLLDAIARSDGTRASVVEELFRTQVTDGLLGSFSFDRNGDISERPVTILQVRRPGASGRAEGIEGGALVRVVRPSASLVAPD